MISISSNTSFASPDIVILQSPSMSVKTASNETSSSYLITSDPASLKFIDMQFHSEHANVTRVIKITLLDENCCVISNFTSEEGSIFNHNNTVVIFVNQGETPLSSERLLLWLKRFAILIISSGYKLVDGQKALGVAKKD